MPAHAQKPIFGRQAALLNRTHTIFLSKQLRRTLKFTNKYGAIEKAVAPTRGVRSLTLFHRDAQVWYRGSRMVFSHKVSFLPVAGVQI